MNMWYRIVLIILKIWFLLPNSSYSSFHIWYCDDVMILIVIIGESHPRFVEWMDTPVCGCFEEQPRCGESLDQLWSRCQCHRQCKRCLCCNTWYTIMMFGCHDMILQLHWMISFLTILRVSFIVYRMQNHPCIRRLGITQLLPLKYW